MKNSVKKCIYKNNVINFIIIMFVYLAQSAGMIVISLMLEKVIAIATARQMDELYMQGIMFLILLASFIVICLISMYVKPIFKKRAMNQYKKNIYERLLDKSITDFNKENTSTYLSA